METANTTANTAEILTFDLGTVQHARQAHAMLRGVAAEIQDTLRNHNSNHRVVGVRVSDVTDVYSEKYSTTYEIGAKYNSHVDGRGQSYCVVTDSTHSNARYCCAQWRRCTEPHSRSMHLRCTKHSCN